MDNDKNSIDQMGSAGNSFSSNPVEIVPVSRVRKIIAERLSQSKFSAPHYYVKISVSTEKLIDARNATSLNNGKKISYNAFIIKAIAEAIQLYPIINASWRGDAIHIFKRIDVGLAVAQPDGLITPVVRDCGNKTIVQIEEELQVLIEKARNRKLLPQEYSNATFTVSNLGSVGIEEFTAIINPPGSAILAVGAMKKEVFVNDMNQVSIETRMKLTLSCDHRVIDGIVAAQFLVHLKELIENPTRLF